MTLKLDEKTKNFINSLTYEELLEQYKIAPKTDPWFQGEIGNYWKKRIKQLKPSNTIEEKNTLIFKAVK